MSNGFLWIWKRFYPDSYSEAIKDSNNDGVECSMGHSLYHFASLHDKKVVWPHLI